MKFWLLIGLGIVAFVALIVVVVVWGERRDEARFAINCRAAGFSEPQCAFLLALKRDRSTSNEMDLAAIHAATH